VASTTCRYFVDQELGRRSREARARGLEAPAASVNELIMAHRVVEMFWGGEGEAVHAGPVELEKRPGESDEAFAGRHEKLVRAAREAAAARVGPGAFHLPPAVAVERAEVAGRSLLVDWSELDDHPVVSGEGEGPEGAAVEAARAVAERSARFQRNGIGDREGIRGARDLAADAPLGGYHALGPAAPLTVVVSAAEVPSWREGASTGYWRLSFRRRSELLADRE
jgi:hypothetical protein